MNQKFVKVDGQNFLVIIGEKGIIISNNECIHSVYTHFQVLFDDTFSYGTSTEQKIDGKNYLVFGEAEVKVNTLAGMKGKKASAESVAGWIRHFGIKARIESNYYLLRESIRKIESDFILPEWKER